MKKFLFSALLAAPFFMNAQSTLITFENLTLQQDSFWNGSDNTGSFTSGGATFGNTYNSDYPGYEFWSGGYAYSNMRNDSTAGAGNIYSAFPAKGATNSTNYALFTPASGTEGYIDFGKTVLINKLSVTNTTYAYLSMKNGDAFAKQFGDSTNAKDFFFVRIYGVDGNDTKTDSVDFYLADYRFDNAQEDYIVDSWEEVELNFSANKLTFALFSSDNGQYGMNTPAFFALDNIEYVGNVGVETLEKSTISIYPNPTTEQLNITGYTGAASIYAMNGQLVKTVQVTEGIVVSVSELTEGIYILKTESSILKFQKK